MRVWLKPYFQKEAMYREHINTLLLRDPKKRVEVVDKPQEADFVVCCSNELKKQPGLDMYGKYIVFCLNDLYPNMGGLRVEDREYRGHIHERKAKLIYIQVEPEPNIGLYTFGHPEGKYPLYRGDDDIIILSMPLMLGGSKQNICYPTDDDSEWYVKKLSKNPKRYKYDWCWIGTESSRDRADMIRALQSFQSANGHKSFMVVTEVIEKDVEMSLEEAAALTHYDNKTVPYNEYIRTIRLCKVNISANGNGVFCPKDGELFSRNCFNLRQYHKRLFSNPLTPRDKAHWIIFRNEDLTDLIEYYVKNDEERERINDAGHEYFAEGISGKFAEYYVDRFEDYLETGKQEAFGKLRAYV